MKICPRCGKANLDNDTFCTGCGLPLSSVAPQPQRPATPQTGRPAAPQIHQPAYYTPIPPKAPSPHLPETPKKPQKRTGLILGILAGVIVIGLLTAILVLLLNDRSASPAAEDSRKETTARQEEESVDDASEEIVTKEPEEVQDQAVSEDIEEETAQESASIAIPVVASLPRRTLFGNLLPINNQELIPSVPAYAAAADFSNIVNRDILRFPDEMQALIAQNGFVVTQGYLPEFHGLYQANPYSSMANFVTVDSILHTYHLYYSYLQKNTEKRYLAPTLAILSEKMLSKSLEQLDALRGTEWEEAARTNVAFFTVASCLQNQASIIAADVAGVVPLELDLIHGQSEKTISPITGFEEDYSNYVPRGYYEGDSQLEAYFRALTWYGRFFLDQSDENADRSALLITMALDKETYSLWEAVYTITSFFGGSANDFTYYEYKPILDASYGSDATPASLPGDSDAWYIFHTLTSHIESPEVNGVSVPQTRGFRFMGLREKIDETIYQNLTYSAVAEKSAEDRRILPDTLDVAAAMGSDQAYLILEAQGATAYPGYAENMQLLREKIAISSEAQRYSNLYSSWLYTLQPLLETKGEGYPVFMQTSLWAEKNLETFTGSYTELKHDFMPYSPQMLYGKGDGGPEITVDDRGYVDPEPEIYSRLSVLAEQTAAGLKGLGMMSDTDESNLLRLAALAKQLMTISEKELTNQTLTDEEYDLIRFYGVELRYFWEESMRDEAEKHPDAGLWPDYFPASLIVDTAVGINGYSLQIANGRPSLIFVACIVDGQIRICSGTVYNWYQFTVPSSERLTDHTWRQSFGDEVLDDGVTYNFNDDIEKPGWTLDYRYILE